MVKLGLFLGMPPVATFLASKYLLDSAGFFLVMSVIALVLAILPWINDTNQL